MAAAFEKQHASRENVDQVLAYLGGGATVASNKFASATQQIRVVSEIQGWLSIGASTTVTVGTNGMKMNIQSMQNVQKGMPPGAAGAPPGH